MTYCFEWPESSGCVLRLQETPAREVSQGLALLHYKNCLNNDNNNKNKNNDNDDNRK